MKFTFLIFLLKRLQRAVGDFLSTVLIFNFGGRDKGSPHNVTEKKKKETVEVNENIDGNWRHSCTPVNEVYCSRAVTHSGMHKH